MGLKDWMEQMEDYAGRRFIPDDLSYIDTAQSFPKAGTRLPLAEDPKKKPHAALLEYQLHSGINLQSPEAQALRPMDRQLTADDWRELQQVNRAVNRFIIYKRDQPGKDQFSDNTKSGDCDDYAIRKYKELVKRGWNPACLSIAIVDTDIADTECHAVLVVHTDKGDFVLDSTTDEIKPWNKTDYAFAKLQSVHGAKVFVPDPNAPVVMQDQAYITRDGLFIGETKQIEHMEPERMDQIRHAIVPAAGRPLTLAIPDQQMECQVSKPVTFSAIDYSSGRKEVAITGEGARIDIFSPQKEGRTTVRISSQAKNNANKVYAVSLEETSALRRFFTADPPLVPALDNVTYADQYKRSVAGIAETMQAEGVVCTPEKDGKRTMEEAVFNGLIPSLGKAAAAYGASLKEKTTLSASGLQQ